MIRRVALLLCLLPLYAACAGSAKAPAAVLPEAGATAEQRSIYVIEQGWHVGLALRRADIPAGMLPEQADFPQARYLELGWGDVDYYQADDPGLGVLFSAALRSRASVLHVVGVEGELREHFPPTSVLRIDVSPAELYDFSAFLHRSFARDDTARVDALGPGLVAGSFFYPASGRFHVFNTCNTWAALALQAAGVPMHRPLPFTAEQLMARVRRHKESEASITPLSTPR